MKHYQISGSLLIVALSLSCISCSKKEVQEKKVGYARFSTKAFEYVKLTEGKYLIYKDSASQTLDSVVVTTAKLVEISFPEYNANPFQQAPAHVAQQYSLVLTKTDGVTEAEWFNGFASSSVMNANFSSDTVPVRLTEKDNMVAFDMSASDNPSTTVDVEGKTYNNVVITKSDNGFAMNDPAYISRSYWWVKNIGIVRRSITTGTVTKTYTLVRYN